MKGQPVITWIPLIIGATATGAVTALRTSLQLPSTLGAVISQPLDLQLRIAGTGAVSATVLLEQSLDNSSWTTHSTLNISGTDRAFQSFQADVRAPYIRANVSAISGTGATVDLLAFVK